MDVYLVIAEDHYSTQHDVLDLEHHGYLWAIGPIIHEDDDCVVVMQGGAFDRGFDPEAATEQCDYTRFLKSTIVARVRLSKLRWPAAFKPQTVE